MAELLELVTGIVDAIGSFLDFLGDMVSDLLSVVKLLGEFVLQVPDYFAWLPAEAVAIIVSIFSVVVLYKILGRD